MPRPAVLSGWLVLLGILAWSYFTSMAHIGFRWWNEADYGHCFFVPVFALVLLLIRRGMIVRVSEDERWRSEFGIIGAAFGAAVGVLLFLIYMIRTPEGQNWLSLSTPVYLLLSAGYGALIVGLFFEVAWLFLRHDLVKPLSADGWRWGLALLVLCALMRWWSAYYWYILMDPASLVPCVAGLVLLVGGWWAMRWAWPSIVFLGFMVPLPGFLADILSLPLQRVGTKVSVFAIQTMGIRTFAEGNKIMLPGGPLEVAVACSGLRMMMLFFAVCVGAAFVMRCALWEKIVIVASAVPIAVISNVLRLIVTALVQEFIGREVSLKLGHDMAGWFMMPLALLLLWGEMALLKKLFLAPVPQGPLSLEGSLAGGTGGVDSQAISDRQEQT